MKKVRTFSKRLTAVILVLSMVLSLCSCGLGDTIKEKANDVGSVISNTTKKALSKSGEFLSKAKDGIISAYGSARDGVIYAYNETADFATATYEKAAAKANEIIGDVGEYIDGLKKQDTPAPVVFAQGDPDHPVKDLSVGNSFDETNAITIDKNYITEQFISFYISSVLDARGYDVYNGAVYYKGDLYGGLIFTKGDVFIEEDGKKIQSCGFIQLVADDYDGVVVTERMVQTGLIAVSSGSYDTEAQAFIVEEYAVFDDFSGIYNDTYFCLKQDDHYVLKVSIKDNKKTNYDSKIELYDFDNEKYIHKADAATDVEQLYVKNNEAFQGAAITVNAIADYKENAGDELATVVVMDGNTLDAILSKAEGGVDSVTKFIQSATKGKKLSGEQFLSIDSDGKAHVLGSDKPVDEARLTNGVIATIGSGLATAGAVASIIYVVHAGVVAVSAIVITTGASAIVYNVSNMIAGTQDVYYGAKGSEKESANPVLQAFKSLIPDEKTATLVYHIWGVSSTVLSTIMIPVSKALNIAKVKALNGFQTAVNVVRASVTQIAKALATGIGAGIVSNYVAKVVANVSNNENLGKLVGFGTCLVSAVFIYKGIDAVDQKLDISGLYPKELISPAFAKAQESQARTLLEKSVSAQQRGEDEENVNYIADLAKEYFDLDSKPIIKIVYNSDVTDCGSYNATTDTLTINMRATGHDQWRALADTIGHEMRHACQYQIALENPNSEIAASLRNYIQFDGTNYEAYSSQLCESDAFQWGENFAEFFMDFAF